MGNSLISLPEETPLLLIDEEGKEYVITRNEIEQCKLGTDNNQGWCYAMRIKKTSPGCLKY